MKSSAASVDILDLPGFSWLREWWSAPFANMRVRHEVRMVLFAELAEALRQGVPLNEVLECLGRTEEEHRNLLLRHEHNYLVVPLLILFCLCAPVLGLIFGIYPLVAARCVNVDGILKYYGRTLATRVAAGQSLADAMASIPFGFTNEEIAIVREAERQGTLPAALKTLSEFGRSNSKLALGSSYGIYPLLMGASLFLPIGYVGWKVFPRFESIFEQLGMESPMANYWNRLSLLFGQAGPILALLAGATILFVLIRHIMNGSTFSKSYMYFSLSTVTVSVGVPLAVNATARSLNMMLQLFMISLSAMFVLLLLFFTPLLMVWLERIVLFIESKFEKIMAKLPAIAPAIRTRREALYLAAFHVATEAGLPETEAVASAGRIVGGSFNMRSNLAVEYLVQGARLGEALERARIFEPALTSRIALIEQCEGFPARLREVASDRLFLAEQRVERALRVAEVVQLAALAFLVIAFMMSIYVPLSMISLSVH